MTSIPETDQGLLAGYGCAGIAIGGAALPKDGARGGYLLIDDLAEGAASLAAVGGERRRCIFVEGAQLTLQALPGRYCTGRADLASGRSQPCPERAVLGDGPGEQCGDCFRATGFNPAFYFAQRISPEQQRRNQEPHVVYLAHFGASTLKVGMTYERRGIGRLLEQGARAGALVARFPDAYAARELEEGIARELGVPEAIRTARKRHLLGAPFSAAVARAELEAELRRIAELRPDLSLRPELFELDSHYGGSVLFEQPLCSQPLQDLSESEPLAISGRCLGMIGDVLITAQAGRRFMLSVGDLVARRVRLSSHEQPNRVSGQLALF
jgi:hypothetical protein